MSPVDRERIVRAVFARAGTPVDPGTDALDFRLACMAAEGAQLFIRALEEDDTLPLPLLTDLLTVVDALREVLGFTRTPVNAEVIFAGLVGRADNGGVLR